MINLDDDEESGFDTSVSTAEPRSSSTDTSASSLIKRARKLANACRPEPKRTVKLQLDSSKVVEDSFIMVINYNDYVVHETKSMYIYNDYKY